MLRKNQSQQSLTRQAARVSLTRKLPSDFFVPVQSAKSLPFRRLKKLSPITNNQNIESPLTQKQNQSKKLIQRKMSFQFTFYRSPSNQEKQHRLFQEKKEKSSKMDILEKFNIKLPYIRSADSGVDRRKKLYKVRRTTNFTKQIIDNEFVTMLR